MSTCFLGWFVYPPPQPCRHLHVCTYKQKKTPIRPTIKYILSSGNRPKGIPPKTETKILSFQPSLAWWGASVGASLQFPSRYVPFLNVMLRRERFSRWSVGEMANRSFTGDYTAPEWATRDCQSPILPLGEGNSSAIRCQLQCCECFLIVLNRYFSPGRVGRWVDGPLWAAGRARSLARVPASGIFYAEVPRQVLTLIDWKQYGVMWSSGGMAAYFFALLFYSTVHTL